MNEPLFSKILDQNTSVIDEIQILLEDIHQNLDHIDDELILLSSLVKSSRLFIEMSTNNISSSDQPSVEKKIENQEEDLI